jgi:hypothetical protein
MLDYTTLLIHPWTQSAQPDGSIAWIRQIAEIAGRPLGFVRLDRRSADSWFFWLRQLRLDVFETEDASHLMSLKRSWTLRTIWELHDAEERHVGYIYPKSLVASEGGMLGFLEFQGRGQGRILDHAGHALAQFSASEADEARVTFTPAPEVNPFLRMLILGAVLALDPKPRNG